MYLMQGCIVLLITYTMHIRLKTVFGERNCTLIEMNLGFGIKFTDGDDLQVEEHPKVLATTSTAHIGCIIVLYMVSF